MTPARPLDDQLPQRLPLPLAQLYRRAHNTKTAKDRHLTAFHLWEASLKLLASAAVIDYADLGVADPDLADCLRNLARPSLGHWWEFARRLVPLLADRGLAGYPGVKELLLGRDRNDLPRAAGLDAALIDALDGKRTGRATVRLAELFDRLVRYRNATIGHGAPGQLREDQAGRMADALLAAAAEVFARLDVLAGRRLVYVEEVRPARGAWQVRWFDLTGESPRRLDPADLPRDTGEPVLDERALYLSDPAAPPASGLRMLHPLLLFDPDPAEVLFLNTRRGKARVEYLCYTTGHLSDREEVGAERRQLLARALGVAVSPADEAAWTARSAAEELPADDGPADPARRRLGEFELISELGRGGMGVVYRAWQPSLGRQVALKRLLPTAGLSRAEERFRREIRALGKVEHPHLVKVFTSGSDGDAWYYAMELVEGAPLAAVCDALASRSSAAAEVDLPTWRASVSTACDKARAEEKPLSDPLDRPSPPAPEPAGPPAHLTRGTAAYVRQVVDLLIQVADAAHALHEAGVVHRDIKPGNVLVGRDGTRGTLMDLGLAQIADEAEGRLTRTRQFVGTLRYASPEQVLAIGAVDRRADVYGLGATLWEVLALRPLFGATEQTPTPQLMMDIQQREPDRLRVLNRSVGRDLEAVVHRCLEKRPEKRYATAADLAADLRRVLAGEPVTARPVGSLDRGLKWVRRHPTISGSVTAVFLALVIGTAVSLAFAVEADHQRDQANTNADTAKRERDAATTARDDLARANGSLEAARNDLQARNDELLGSVARNLLAPVGLTDSHWRMSLRLDSLTAWEIETFWELARNRREPLLGPRFVAEATRSPVAARQLLARVDYALHAVVGLDLSRRAEVERILRDRLADGGLTDDQRVYLAVAAAALGDLNLETTVEVAGILTAYLERETDFSAKRVLAEALIAVTTRLDRGADAARVCRPVAVTLARALARETDADARQKLAEALSAVTARLDPADAAKVCRPAADTLARALARATDPDARRVLAAALSAVTARLDPADTATLLASALARETNPYDRRALAEQLRAVVGWLDPDERQQCAAAVALTFGLPIISPGYLLGVPPALAPTLRPRPVAIPPQRLVDLLKHPLCVGDERRAILDVLQVQFDRPFADQWEFVRFVQEKNLPLDLLTPPVRPVVEPRATPPTPAKK